MLLAKFFQAVDGKSCIDGTAIREGVFVDVEGRVVPTSSTSPVMMLLWVPPFIIPTVRTKVFCGSFTRLDKVCRPMTTAAAATIASLP